MVIPFYSCKESLVGYWDFIERRVDRIIRAGVYSNGTVVTELEGALCDYTGAKHAVGVSNGTEALILTLQAAGVGPGDEVIVPTFTFVASATSVAHVGAKPIFADIDPDTYALNPAEVRLRLTTRTRAIMPVHLFSQMAPMSTLMEVAQRHGVPILEDSAEAIGMHYNGRHAGLLGKAGILSFFPTKTLGAFGDAGMILTDDDDIAQRCRELRSHGRTQDGEPSLRPGHNAKMDELQAAVLLARLPHLANEIQRRAELAWIYDERLRPLAPLVRTPVIVDHGVPTNPVFYVYVIRAERRDDLVRHLEAQGIGTEVYYPRPLHLQPCFANLGHQRGTFPVAEHACEETIALPLYPDLTIDDAKTVCRMIESFYAGEKK